MPGRAGPDRSRHADEIAAIQAGLARLIEGEILPCLARSLPPTRRRPSTVISPTAERIAAFAQALIVKDPDEIEVAALTDEGLPLATLLLDLLAPAARHLGATWEEGEADCVEVTLGLGRLHALVRSLCDRMESPIVLPIGRRALLLPCPGETHLFSLSGIASFFREAGWDVIVTRGEDDDPVARVREERFDVVGISLSCDVLLSRMTDHRRAAGGVVQSPPARAGRRPVVPARPGEHGLGRTRGTN